MSEETVPPTAEASQNAENVETENETVVKTEPEQKDAPQQEEEAQPTEQVKEEVKGEEIQLKAEEQEAVSNPAEVPKSGSPLPNKISGATIKSQFVRLRGLPFNATEKDIQEFFTGLTVKRVKFVCTTGRPNGEAYVEFSSIEDAEKGFENDRKEMNSRYIEIFSVPEAEGEFEFRPDADGNGEENHVVRLRGVPWSCKEEDVTQFFSGLEPAPAEIVIGGTGGPRSRPSGEAFARFTTQAAAEKALEYNNMHMGNRYVEVFMSSMVELNRAKGGGGAAGSYEQRSGIRPLMSLDRSDSGYHQQSRGGGFGYGQAYDDYSQGAYGTGGRQDYGYSSYDQGGYGDGGYGNGGGYEGPLRIYMRGLPYDADHHAIEAFFSPLRVHSIKLGINESGRASGDAIAEFDSYQDLQAGLSRNNHRMGRRYVELFDTRAAPGPMRRLLWKETTGPNVMAAPALDPVLNGGKRAAPPARDPVYRAGPQAMPPSHRESRDPYGPRAPTRSYEREQVPQRAPAPAHGRAPDPWGPYGASYDQGNTTSSAAASWDAYYNASANQATGYGASGAQSGYQSAGYQSTGSSYGSQPSAGGYDRQREPRDAQSPWAQQQQQQSSYGGWGTGATSGDRRGY